MQPLPSSLHFFLQDHDATIALGAFLADVMLAEQFFPALLLDGELGAGKTTFVRGLVHALPGGDQAEVASPSFNYLNNYPTTPETFHFDFYRLRDFGPDDDLLDALHDPSKLVIVEWAAYCPSRHLPTDHLAMRFTPVAGGRRVDVVFKGKNSEGIMESFDKTLPSNFLYHDAMQGAFPSCGS
ncbi:tRNA threonylcarbamoyladenosine biosynthesis protein TsaE [Desulfonatronum thiosulfatophilum]|uniref:tRNA threonylcarbamoyladenosine biosynthesis protein TsaE n=1 Tax=Desulfonatronum thiosulfatophilum TaxID=617002 RepID=A0A1G6DD35_9BACT|nr:tRNA (adenosine(37)-N6)-threonylcarbamoyltransferase complex ATPase subunit type 1 TsaE [Desulfonatronum thiosulfatophilum]SDB43032.1 tRNA threonylcarbamoyladenosine biosynthesis protein TsaE [Desulfonatronum thiosulfatophilum]